MKAVFIREQILDLENSLSKEYLLTNGLGSYCSSTILDCHTRKYHGLLAAFLPKLNSVYMLVSKLELSLIIGKKEFHLSTNKFPGVFHSTGHKYIEKFEIEYIPTTTYKIADTILIKSIIMPHYENTVLARYELVAGQKSVTLKVTPFLAYRQIHEITYENTYIRPRTFFEENGFKIDPYQKLPPLYIQTSKHSLFYPAPCWWKNFEYLKERRRGYEYAEDLFNPGVFEVKLKKGEHVVFRVSIQKKRHRINYQWQKAREHISKLKQRFSQDSEPLKTLKIQAEHYLTAQKRGIIAGFHWFGEWGRDTMLSLPGITICRDDKKSALDILKRYTKYEKNGLLPNILDTTAHQAYNSIDTSLLFFWAIQKYIAYTHDKKNILEYLLPTMIKIIASFLNKKTPLVEIKENGLLYAGNKDTQLTWMDAQVNSRPVTPRHGAAVEINALWYNALCFLLNHYKKQLPQKLHEHIKKACTLFKENFIKIFWNETQQSLLDVYTSNQDFEDHI